MELFSSELEALGVEDRADIIAEYENHFAFRLADGYTEEEIAAVKAEADALLEEMTKYIEKDDIDRRLVLLLQEKAGAKEERA